MVLQQRGEDTTVAPQRGPGCLCQLSWESEGEGAPTGHGAHRHDGKAIKDKPFTFPV